MKRLSQAYGLKTGPPLVAVFGKVVEPLEGRGPLRVGLKGL